MPVFLKNSHSLDTFACDCCGGVFPRIALHEHHKIKKADGGQDTRDNIAILDAQCHHALHEIEKCLRNDKKRHLIPDMLRKLFPANQKARENCLYFATTAALSTDKRNPENTRAAPDYSDFDTDDCVHLPPPKVTPAVRDLIHRVVGTMKNPKTGRKLGVSTYIKLLIEQDLKKRGFKI